ncbi:MAG: nitroreductase family protein [Desulfobulbaceae bacterium]|nr:nitroreductase family protein [Desulfobulbaceae bacterium]
MELRDLVLKNRSCRRFHQKTVIEHNTLLDLVDLARLSASAKNLQPLKYCLIHDAQQNKFIFPLLAWAGYLDDWSGPIEGERPSGYIVVLGDENIADSFDCDLGIAVQSILLGAREKGLGGCIIASIDRQKMRKRLKIAASLKILVVIALGKPKETIVIDEMGNDGSIKYWREPNGTHHVPKRSLKDIIVS